jgi:hypothetical protein
LFVIADYNTAGFSILAVSGFFLFALHVAIRLHAPGEGSRDWNPGRIRRGRLLQAFVETRS